MRYPLLAVYAAVPLVTFAADNRDLVNVADLAPYYAGVLVPAAVATALVARRRGAHAADRASACLCVAILVTFDYRDIRTVLGPVTHHARLSMVFLWAVLLGAAMLLMTRAARRFRALPGVMLAAGAVMLVPPIAALTSAHARTATNVPVVASAPRGLDPVLHPTPNVYFFMLDAYGRADRLRQQFGFDDSPFIHSLRGAGFVVPRRTEAAYGNTELSVPSILAMDYSARRSALPPDALDAIHAGKNPVVASFRELGYSFTLAPPEVFGWDCEGYEDRCIHPRETYGSSLHVSELSWTLMRRTPAADFVRGVARTDPDPLAATRQFPLEVASAVTRAGRYPMFTYAHVLLTHWPYLYLGKSCALRDPRGQTTAPAYLGAIACANANTLAAVRLIQRRDPSAVIVLASDHGSDVGANLLVPQSRWPRREVQFRFSNFVALRLPKTCRHEVPDHLGAVNIFRVVLSCLTGRRLPLLPARHYLRDDAGLRMRPA
jgi:hypothetical protein